MVETYNVIHVLKSLYFHLNNIIFDIIIPSLFLIM